MSRTASLARGASVLILALAADAWPLEALAGGGGPAGDEVKGVPRGRPPRLLDEPEPTEEEIRERRYILSTDALISRGEELLDAADRLSTMRAVEMFRFALEVDPNCGQAHAGLARAAVHRLARRWEEDDALIDEAISQARHAVEIAPGDPRSHAALAVAFLLAENDAAAEEATERAWALRSEASPPWIREAQAAVLIARGQAEDALRLLQEVPPGRVGRAQSHYLMGNAHLECGRPDEANLSYRRALLLNPDFVPAQIQIALTYEKAGDLQRATRWYKRITERYPEEKNRVLTRMAQSLMSRRKHEEALLGLGQVEFKTRRGLGQGTVLYLQAACHEALHRADQARTLYRRVIEEHPFASFGSIPTTNLLAASYEALARLALGESKSDEAVALLEKATAAEPPSAEVFLRLARVYRDYGLHLEAYKVLERASSIDLGPRRVPLKMALYVEWARAARASQGTPAAPAGEAVLAALGREETRLAEQGREGDFLEAARACAIAGSPGRALAWVRRAVERGYDHLDWIASDAEMSAIAGEPGFEALRRRPPSFP